MTELTLPIIGYMRSPYKEKFGIPRQPNLVQVESYIEMVGPYNDLLAFEELKNSVICGWSGNFMTIKTSTTASFVHKCVRRVWVVTRK